MGTLAALSTGDPHLALASGGHADFRGEDKRIFAFISAPNLLNAMTEDRIFRRWGGQEVNGSFVTRIFVKMRSPKTGITHHLMFRSTEWGTFRLYEVDDDKVAEGKSPAYTNHTRLFTDAPDLEAAQLRNGAAYVKAAGWEVVLQRHTLRMPIVDGMKAPKGHYTRYFMDMTYRLADRDPALVAKFGRSTVGSIAPHGLIGQSFDGSNIAVSGKLDNYGDKPTFTTSAQAEGAIEGVYTDYIVPDPFSTLFKFSRFDAREPIAPRDVNALSGIKSAAVGDGFSAGVTELHGVESQQQA